MPAKYNVHTGPNSASDVASRTADVRKAWPRPERRVKADPDFALCVAILNRARLDVLVGQSKLNSLLATHRDLQALLNKYRKQIKATRESLRASGVAINWTQHPEHQWMALDTIAKRAGYDPQKLSSVILKGMDVEVIDYIENKPGAPCPLCRRIASN